MYENVRVIPGTSLRQRHVCLHGFLAEFIRKRKKNTEKVQA